MMPRAPQKSGKRASYAYAAMLEAYAEHAMRQRRQMRDARHAAALFTCCRQQRR